MPGGLRALVYSPTEELDDITNPTKGSVNWAASTFADIRELFPPPHVFPADGTPPQGRRGIRPRGEPPTKFETEKGELDLSSISSSDKMACGLGCTGFEGFWTEIKLFLGLEDPLQRLPSKRSARKLEDQYPDILRSSVESQGPAFAIGDPQSAASSQRPYTAGGPLPQAVAAASAAAPPSLNNSTEFPSGVHSSYYAPGAFPYGTFTGDVTGLLASGNAVPLPVSSVSYGLSLPPLQPLSAPQQPSYYASVDLARDATREALYGRPTAPQILVSEPPKHSAQVYAQQMLAHQQRIDEERRQQQRMDEERLQQMRLQEDRTQQQALSRAAAEVVHMRQQQQQQQQQAPAPPQPALLDPEPIQQYVGGVPVYYPPSYQPGSDIYALPTQQQQQQQQQEISPPRRPAVVYEPFVSGLWRGFYQYLFGERDEMKLNLDMRDGKIRADGVDNVGRYTIQGQYDPATREVFFVKSYQGKHSVEYAGFAEEDSISGDWEVLNIPGQAFQLRGSFRMWKPGAFSPELLDAL